MGIIIKADMPIKCEECRFHAKRAYSNYGYVHFCYAQEMAEKDKTDELMKRCPILGEIPDEHGRLVDKDAILDAYNKELYYWQESPRTAHDELVHIVQNAPTVVEATT